MYLLLTRLFSTRNIEHMFDTVPLVEAAAKVAAFDVALACDDELLEMAPLLEQARRAVDAALGSSLGELDRRGTTDERFGHRTAQWFALTTGTSRSDAKRRVQCGRRLARLDVIRDALAHGEMSWEHARVVTDLATPHNAGIVADLQHELLNLANVMPFEQWRLEAKGLIDLADTDGSFRPGPETSTLRMTTGFAGSVELAGTLTALDGAALREVLEATANKLRLRYRNEQHAGVRDTIPTRAELLAEALATLVRTGVASTSVGHSPVTELTLIAQAADPVGSAHPHHNTTSDTPTDVSAETIRTLCCDPMIRTVVLNSLGNPVNLGRRTRIVPRSLRRALEVRDGGCVFPGCDAPPSWCDSHHVTHWADGGPSSADNLASLCRHHHGVTHRNGWHMTTDPERPQRFTWTRPDGTQLRSQRRTDRTPSRE